MSLRLARLPTESVAPFRLRRCQRLLLPQPELVGYLFSRCSPISVAPVDLPGTEGVPPRPGAHVHLHLENTAPGDRRSPDSRNSRRSWQRTRAPADVHLAAALLY